MISERELVDAGTRNGREYSRLIIKQSPFFLTMEGLVGGIILILALFYLLGIPSPSKEDIEKMESKNPDLVFWQWAIILFGLFILGLGFSRTQ